MGGNPDYNDGLLVLVPRGNSRQLLVTAAPAAPPPHEHDSGTVPAAFESSPRLTDDGYLENAVAGLVLDVEGGKHAEKTRVWMYRKNGSAAQKWKLTDDGYLDNAVAGLVLDVEGGNHAEMTRVWMYRKNGSAAQKWKLTRGVDSSLDLSMPRSSRSEQRGRRAHIPQLQRAKSEEIRVIWSRENEPPPEYEQALSLICLQPSWILRTRLSRYLQAMTVRLRSDPRLSARLSDGQYCQRLSKQLVRKAYVLPSDQAAAEQKDLLTGRPIVQVLQSLFNDLGWRQPFLSFALESLVSHEKPDAIIAKLSEVCDRAPRCSSAKRQAFNLLVAHAYHLHEQSAKAPSEVQTKEDACVRLEEMMEDYLDDHKERAFNSAFMEPARCYFNAVGDGGGRDHVNVHGLNWYLALVHSTLGMELPLMPEYNDVHVMGVADFWVGLTDEVWEAFADPFNFGKEFEGIPMLRHGRNLIRQRVPNGDLPRGHRTARPKDLGNTAVDLAAAAKSRREALKIYLERYAHFFSRDYFIRKAFECLNTEVARCRKL